MLLKHKRAQQFLPVPPPMNLPQEEARFICTVSASKNYISHDTGVEKNLMYCFSEAISKSK
jgi:hypothetical protein